MVDTNRTSKNTIMNELKVNKNDLMAAYRAGNADQKAVLEKLHGKEVFNYDWHEITSYEKACEVLGIEARKFKEIGDRPQYMKMANAVQQLLVICEAINANGKWYDKDGFGYYPVFVLYSKEEMDVLGEAECKRKVIHHLLAAADAGNSERAGVSCTYTYYRGAVTHATYGFPLCLNSDEKAKFVGKQFFELCCQCYGLTPKMY